MGTYFFCQNTLPPNYAPIFGPEGSSDNSPLVYVAINKKVFKICSLSFVSTSVKSVLHVTNKMGFQKEEPNCGVRQRRREPHASEGADGHQLPRRGRKWLEFYIFLCSFFSPCHIDFWSCSTPLPYVHGGNAHIPGANSLALSLMKKIYYHIT